MRTWSLFSGLHNAVKSTVKKSLVFLLFPALNSQAVAVLFYVKALYQQNPYPLTEHYLSIGFAGG